MGTAGNLNSVAVCSASTSNRNVCSFLILILVRRWGHLLVFMIRILFRKWISQSWSRLLTRVQEQQIHLRSLIAFWTLISNHLSCIQLLSARSFFHPENLFKCYNVHHLYWTFKAQQFTPSATSSYKFKPAMQFSSHPWILHCHTSLCGTSNKLKPDIQFSFSFW